MSDKLCMFAGQGAQFPGMGRDFAEDPEIAALFSTANDVLGFDIAKLCFEGPAEEMTKSNICQPGIFIVSVAAYKAFQKKYPGVSFKMAAGLSLGEWSALHVAGVLDFESALKVLEARGRFMQEACEEQDSGMVSIMGAAGEQLEELCSEYGITIANINSDSQVVLSGVKSGVESAAEAAREMGLKAIVLNVAGAFHSPLMATARTKLADVIEDVQFSKPQMPVLANVTGKVHSDDVVSVKDAMLRQVTDSVLWRDCILTAKASGVENFIEFGPGKVLSGLLRRIDRSLKCANVQDAASLERCEKIVG
ncbi:MAG: ACP S-malonyltransferase [Kiritimatiellia bacterium]